MKSIFAVIVLLSVALGSAIAAPTPTAVVLEIPNAVQPQLTVGADGRVWLIYTRIAEPASAPAAPAHEPAHAHAPKKQGYQPQGRRADIFVAVSDDGGVTFSSAMKVASLPNLLVGMRRGPRIASHGDRLTVTVVADELFAFVSDDGGKNWGSPVAINAVPTSAREGLHDLAVAPDGSLFVTWLDLRNGKMELWGARSQDGGYRWTPNEQVYRSPDVSICECCHPTALFDSDGNLAVMWRNAIDGSRDMWIATRGRAETRFAPAHKLGQGTWKLEGCPMDGGRIIALGGGKFSCVWQRSGEIFYTPVGGAEVSFGQGRQPVAVERGDEILVVCQRGPDLVSAVMGKDETLMKCATDARFPVLAALRDQRGALLAYEHLDPGSSAISIVVERL